MESFHFNKPTKLTFHPLEFYNAQRDTLQQTYHQTQHNDRPNFSPIKSKRAQLIDIF